MYNELTPQDIAKMQQELDELRLKVLPDAIEEVKRTRAFGDLSENYEYKAAKQAQNACKKRIRYLDRMIQSATVIEDHAGADEVGLFDTVEYYVEEDDCIESVRIVTSLRQNSLERLISRESPLGRAVMGKKVGDRVCVKVSDEYSYYIVIRSIIKGGDDKSLEIRKF